MDLVDLYYVIILFILGSVLGSFYNVVGLRLPNKESISYPPSHCPKCKHRLKWYELIPIFSFLLQMGRCRGCRDKISPFYAIVEFSTGALFAIAYLVFGLSWELGIALTFISLTSITLVSDFKYYIILDEVLIVSSIFIVIFTGFISGFNGIFNSLISAVVAFTLMFSLKLLGNFLFKKESMGDGDIKLMFVIGLIIGYQMSIVSIFIASVIALPISLIYLAIKKDNILPFGPYLCAATLIIIFLQIDINYILNLIS